MKQKISVRGVTYHVSVDGVGPPLLMLHGFTGSIRSWDGIIEGLMPSFTTVRVDLLGHGHSDAPLDDRRYALTEVAQDLPLLMSRLGFDRFHLFGYSLGGRTASHVALAISERITSLILESASPGIEDPVERRTRIESDMALARFIEDKGIGAFTERWEKVPLFATERKLPLEVREARRQERLANRTTGLAGSLRGAGAGRQEYLLEELRRLSVPTLLIAGALDKKYSALAEQMAATMPHARATIVPGAGHAVHLEQSDAFIETVLDFLREQGGTS